MYCCVKKCLRNEGERSSTSLHKLPENDEIANIWRINLKSGEPADTIDASGEIYVCSDHFSDSCFVTTEDGTPTNELLPNAVPSMFPWMSGKRKRKLSTEVSSDSSAMKIIVKRTTKNKWKINDENKLEEVDTENVTTDGIETETKPQPIVLRMRRKKKKHLRHLQIKSKYTVGNLYKKSNQMQANAIKAKYKMSRKNQALKLAQEDSLFGATPVRNPGIIIDPHKFTIIVPYVCKICGFFAHNICDYVMHIKADHYNKESYKTPTKTKESEESYPQNITQEKTVEQSTLNFNAGKAVEKYQPEISATEMESLAPGTEIVLPSSDGLIIDEVDTSKEEINLPEDETKKEHTLIAKADPVSKSDTGSEQEKENKISPLSKRTSAKLDKIVTNLLTIKQDISDNIPDSFPVENKTEPSKSPKNNLDTNVESKFSKSLLSDVQMIELQCVKKLGLSKETVSIFEEAFETFPYLTEEEYSSLSTMTGVGVKNIESVFHAARIKQGISWEVHQIKAAAMALGKQK